MIATDAAKRSEQADTMTSQRSTDGNTCTDKFGCNLWKPYKKDKTGFTSMDDAKVYKWGGQVAATITARYYKGIGAHGDNMIDEVYEKRRDQ